MKISIIKLLLTLCALAVLLVAGGCGDGDENEASAGNADEQPLSKPAFIKQVNKICAESTQQIRAESKVIFQELKSGNLEGSFAETFIRQALAPGLEARADAIEELAAPAGDEDEVEAIISAIRAIAIQAQEDSTLGTDPYGETRRLTKAYGLADCGSL